MKFYPEWSLFSERVTIIWIHTICIDTQPNFNLHHDFGFIINFIPKDIDPLGT